MFRKDDLAVRTREEVGSNQNIKFIEPNYRKLGFRHDALIKSIALFKLLIVGLLIFLSVRILFMNAGYLDLAAKKNQVQSLEVKYLEIINENKELEAEVKKIKENSSYQKYLAREHLGVIADDELMILFKSKPLRKKSLKYPQS